MPQRFLSIWFRYLKTDWISNRRPLLRNVPFVLSAPDHGRLIVAAANAIAQQKGICEGMVLADARAICPTLEVINDIPRLPDKLLKSFALWCIRFTPVVAVDPPAGLILNISGCAHLWGGEINYAKEIKERLQKMGYYVIIGIADTIGAAWAISRLGKKDNIIDPGNTVNALQCLPSAALRIDNEIIERLGKLGLNQIGRFLHMPRQVLRRRFGPQLIQRLDQALGYEEEILQPVQPVPAYQERLPCLEPIATATGISIALEQLLDKLCERLKNEGKGLRQVNFTCYRIDNNIQQVTIGTHRASNNPKHIYKLFEEKLTSIEPALGIELFALDATKVEDVSAMQEKLWEGIAGLQNNHLAELIDRISNKIGADTIHRYLPDEHYWPERSIRLATSVNEKANTGWRTDRSRPLQLLPVPQCIQVTAPIPDYPPMLFRYQGKLHSVKKADGPERIEQEWWLQEGQHRDYYIVEDEEGTRYWLFRLGHYDPAQNNQWFLHGFFA
jgi:protein ImuB